MAEELFNFDDDNEKPIEQKPLSTPQKPIEKNRDKKKEKKEKIPKESIPDESKSDETKPKTKKDQLDSQQITEFLKPLQTEIEQLKITIHQLQQNDSIIIQPQKIDSFAEQINIMKHEQDIINTKLNMIDKFKEIIELRNTPQIEQNSIKQDQIMFYDADSVIQYIRKKFPQLDSYSNNELRSEKTYNKLDFYKKLEYTDKQLLTLLSRVIRDRGTIDLHNRIQIQMNIEKFQKT